MNRFAGIALLLLFAAGSGARADGLAGTEKISVEKKVSTKEIADFEYSTKSALGSLRAGIAIFFGEHEMWPSSLPAEGDYIRSLPPLNLPHHSSSAEVTFYNSEACGNSERYKDTGQWGYFQANDGPCAGTIFIDCSHKDSTGRRWDSY